MDLRTQVGFWLKEFHSEEELVSALMDILERDAKRISDIQMVLGKELEGEDGHRLSRQIRWLDAQLYFVSTLKADADALLDKAEEFFKVPQGRCVPCTTEDGQLIPERGSKGNPGDEDFKPRYEKLTDHDRVTLLAAKVSPFRRLRDEYGYMHDAIIGRLYRAKDIMEELKARHAASGLSDAAHQRRL